MLRQLPRFLLPFGLALCVLLAVRPAWSASELDVRPAKGELPLTLAPSGGSFAATVIVQNRGREPVSVEAALREGSELDPRLPPGMNVRFKTGGKSTRLAGGESRELTLELVPVRGARVHETYGHLLVSSDAQEKPVVLGFHFALPGAEAGLGGHLLSFILLVPFLAALLLFGLRGREPRAGMARSVVAGAALIQLALVAWASARFDVAHTRFQGSDGLQLMERVVLSKSFGIEWFLATDGISLALATVVPALVAAVAFSSSRPGELARIGGFALLLDAALLGVFFSFDLALLGGFWVIAAVASVLLVAEEHADQPRLHRGLAIQLGIGALLVLGAIWQLSTHALPSYALDGSAQARVFNLTELAHGGFQPASESWLGVHPVKAVYAALFLGAALTLGLPPFHAWLGGLLRRSSSAVGTLLAGGLSLLGGYALLRVGYAALPQGTAWAAPVLGMWGVVAAAWAALGLLGTRDLRSVVAHGVALQSGLVLLALSSLTAIGISAVVLLLVSRTFWVALLLAIVALLQKRSGTLLDLRGAGAGRPLLALLGAVGLGAIAGAPGTLTYLADVATFVGALPTRKWVALVAPLVMVLAAVGCARAFVRVFLGEPTDGSSPVPEEPDLRVLLALALLLVGLGLWPRPLAALADASCLDQAELVNKPGVFEVVELPSERGGVARSR